MTPEDIISIVKSAVKEAVEDVVPITVEKVVNGKIKLVQDTLDKHIITSNEHWLATQTFMQNLKPVSDGLFTLQSLNKFVKWLSFPSLIAFLAWLFNKA